MTRLYLIRHCEALGNVQRLFQGSTDLDISEIGEKQLKYLKERFEGIRLDAVYSSPLIRAQKTAHAVADGKNLPVELHCGLGEIDGGSIEGKPFLETFEKFPELAKVWEKHPEDFAPEGGEPMRHSYERIWDTVLDIANKNKGRITAAATHGGVLRALMCRLTKTSIEQLREVPWSENTAVSILDFDDDMNVTIKLSNDISHLPDELLPKRSRLSAFLGGEKA